MSDFLFTPSLEGAAENHLIEACQVPRRLRRRHCVNIRKCMNKMRIRLNNSSDIRAPEFEITSKGTDAPDGITPNSWRVLALIASLWATVSDLGSVSKKNFGTLIPQPSITDFIATINNGTSESPNLTRHARLHTKFYSLAPSNPSSAISFSQPHFFQKKANSNIKQHHCFSNLREHPGHCAKNFDDPRVSYSAALSIVPFLPARLHLALKQHSNQYPLIARHHQRASAFLQVTSLIALGFGFFCSDPLIALFVDYPFLTMLMTSIGPQYSFRPHVTAWASVLIPLIRVFGVSYGIQSGLDSSVILIGPLLPAAQIRPWMGKLLNTVLIPIAYLVSSGAMMRFAHTSFYAKKFLWKQKERGNLDRASHSGQGDEELNSDGTSKSLYRDGELVNPDGALSKSFLDIMFGVAEVSTATNNDNVTRLSNHS